MTWLLKYSISLHLSVLTAMTINAGHTFLFISILKIGGFSSPVGYSIIRQQMLKRFRFFDFWDTFIVSDSPFLSYRLRALVFCWQSLRFT